MSLPLLRKKARLSLEMIDFQSDDFGGDMELIITEIQKKVFDNVYQTSKEIEESREVKDLSNLIFDRFGLRVKLICHSALAAILPFYSNKNHIFLADILRGNFVIKNQQKIIDASKGKKGTVNTAKAKVGGIFSEYENFLYLNFKELFKTYKMSVPEVVAIALHELGHAFYACEYSDRLETSNQVLQNIAQELSSKKDNSDQVYIYRELKGLNKKICEEEVEKLVKGNRVIAGLTWFKIVAGVVESQLSNDKYSETSFEQLADNFASRFKYSRQLITALDKISGHNGTIEKMPKWMAFSQTVEVLQFVTMAVLSATFITVSLPTSVMFGLLTYLTLRLNGEDMKDYTYDELKIRYKRIRNEYVGFLKNLDIPAQTVKDTLDDIYIIDKAIDDTHRYNTILMKAANFLFSDAREAKAKIAEEQMLEDLAMNDMFVLSAQLRTLNT